VIAKQAEVAQMQALYDLRSQQRQALLVRAGMEGILEEVSVGTGQQVGSGTILARVANTSRLMARIHVPEAQAGNVDVNQPASITLQDRSYAAKVVHVDPNVQNGTVSIDFEIRRPAAARGAHGPFRKWRNRSREDSFYHLCEMAAPDTCRRAAFLVQAFER
jgi:HlyD family secretion protein